MLGIDVAAIKIRCHGDTALTPYSDRHLGLALTGDGRRRRRRRACENSASAHRKIGATCCRPISRASRCATARAAAAPAASASRRSRTPGTCAPQDLPADVDPGGLEVTAGYKPQRDTGTFSYAAHAAVVAVDPETGDVEILDYVVVEDGGMLVNPMVVDGQIYGGIAQGIGTALYEEMPFDAQRPAARLHARRLPAAGPDRSARVRSSTIWRRRRPTRVRRQGHRARAAPSRRRPRSPMRSTMRCGRSASSCCDHR